MPHNGAAPAPAFLTHSPMVFVTGLSGAGMASALKNLEDIGYEAIDNLPLDLLDSLTPGKSGAPLAVGVDSRTRSFSPDRLIAEAKTRGAAIVFLTCDDEILQRRFTQTRRSHPMARGDSIPEGIARERVLMEPLRLCADIMIDTSDLSVHDLRHILEGHFGPERSGKLSVKIMSFSYRNGLPREADLVFDVRFLRNPYWNPALRPLTGKDAAVRDDIAQDESFAPFVAGLEKMLETLLPLYVQEGKRYLTLAFGCSGGQHRSVALAERIGQTIAALPGYAVTIRHRELGT